MAKGDERAVDFRHRFLGARNGVRFARMNFSSLYFHFSWSRRNRRRARHFLAAGIAAVFICVILAPRYIDAAQKITANRDNAPAKPSQAAETDRSAKSPHETKSYEIAFKEFKLTNGLRVLLAEDHSAPTYSICVTYNVGSRDERPGRTGFAHLFEHMLFQGSANVGKGEHFILIQNNGGSANGTTNMDRTNYFETLPANQLELGIFLEADRMSAAAITQANFDNQRLTVQEERRQSYDNRPYGKTYEAVIDLAYDNFAYKHSTIGSMDDLNAATIEDAELFFAPITRRTTRWSRWSAISRPTSRSVWSKNISKTLRRKKRRKRRT